MFNIVIFREFYVVSLYASFKVTPTCEGSLRRYLMSCYASCKRARTGALFLSKAGLIFTLSPMTYTCTSSVIFLEKRMIKFSTSLEDKAPLESPPVETPALKRTNKKALEYYVR